MAGKLLLWCCTWYVSMNVVGSPCVANVYYCGYKLAEKGYHSATPPNTLYQCKSDNQNVRWIEDCTVSCQDGEQSHCKGCTPNYYYCGRELHSKGFPNLTSNALYHCSSSGYPDYQEMCNESCIVSSSSSSYCSRTCTVGKLYCGTDLGLLERWSPSDVKAVYRCQTGVNSTQRVHSCIGRCLAGRCTEDCKANRYYCGHELKWKGYANAKHHSLYQCNSDQHTVSWIDNCTVSCKSADQSYCTCQPYTSYCGSQLQSRRFSDLKRNALYRCSSSGRPEYQETCSGSCIVASPSHCIQNCTVGRKYCGRDLNLLKNWSVLPSEMDYLYTCTTSSSVTSRVCPMGCVSDINAHCRENCVPGVNYCGLDLAQFEGWNPREAKSVYRCREDGQDANYVKLCRGNCVNGDCVEHCSMDKYYCGYELNNLESWSVPTERHNYLYKCKDGSEVDIASECSRATCLSTGGQPHCSCVQSFLYCGSELLSLGYKGPSNNTVYLCKSGGLPDRMQACEKNCIASKVNSSCERTCVAGKYYCGSESPSIGHHANNLYVCVFGRLVWPRTCSSRCITAEAGTAYCAAECESGRLYCGYELEQIEFAVSRSNNVYLCTNRTSIALNETCNIKCETGQPAHCNEQCTPGLLCCGHELREAGSTIAKNNNSLYLCTASKAVTEADVCPSSCIVGRLNSTCAPADLVIDIPNSGTMYSTYIGGGKPSKRDSYPWMVSLRNASAIHKCGGVLIDPQWILTAAHCVEGKDEKLGSIIIGEFKLQEYDKGQVNGSVARIILYPTYNSTVMQSGDLALVRLSKKVTYSPFVRPVCLPQDADDTVQPNISCAVVGWGAMQWGDNVGYTSTPNEMQHGKLKVLEHQTCADKFSGVRTGKDGRRIDYTYNSSVMICAGSGDAGDAVPCKGDSGGPLLCRKSDDASWVVHGIVSYGRDACKVANSRPYVFTNVATFVAWIHQTISNETTSDFEYSKMSADTDGFEALTYEIATPMPDSDRFGAMVEPSNTLTVSPYELHPETVAIPSNETMHHSVSSNSQSVGSK